MAKAKVSIAKAENYEEAQAGIRAVMEPLGGFGAFIKDGQSVWLKPNMVRPLPTVPALTDARFMAALIREIKEQTDPSRIVVADAPFRGYPGVKAFNFEGEYSGLKMKDTVEKEGAEVIYLDEYEWETVEIPDAKVLREVEVSKLRNEVDVIINVPKLKTHVQPGITVALKNWHGFISWKYRRLWHSDNLSQKLVDIFKAQGAMPDLNIVDGIIGVHEFGPSIAGLPYESKTIIASADPVATDAVAAYMMGWDNPFDVEMVRIGDFDGVGVGDISKIEIVGEPLHQLEGWIRPNMKLIAEYPNINVIVGSYCAGCKSRLKFALENILKRGLWPKYFEHHNPLTLVCGVGAKLPEPSEDVLYLGDCIQFDTIFDEEGNPHFGHDEDTVKERKKKLDDPKAIWLKGCPIWFTEISDLIKERVEKIEEKT